ncbi:MAG: glutamine--fructose-6-phosphate transaminase (isomerizing) [Candidatus Fermentithermobacillus carboniphilus]|uniref:Glutamine--fructose-6-phosphate aminotransferase [isomerizing] n=1 Tax=Candidatus Fermentithermobacillus carboniphilus TaxID=3085328 RepID=A0AAT9LA93_9FIRM|nr:MAG: glutamine--fructose-6-phosphate transaminase (isomerizing) [Candidatus Fermentithermobacillus carboniphilus]
MCGIVGYVGTKEAAPLIWDALLRLEYRGYDSSGIAVLDGQGISTVKCKGRLSDLKARLRELPAATLGIGHTRWATHGVPSDRNAHPHRDCTGNVVLVHNGIIENHRELRERLLKRGHRIESETDTELVAHLIEEEYDGNLASTVAHVSRELEGSMAFAVIHASEPGKIVVYRDKNPLIIGLGDGENFVASDIPAILPYTRKVIVLNDGECAEVTRDGILIKDYSGRIVHREPVVLDARAEAGEKGGYEHFMLKEIFEQPEALSRAISARIRYDRVILEEEEFGLSADEVKCLDKVYLVACGTAYHAGLVGKMLIERLAGIPAEAVLASEFRYAEPIIPRNTLCILLSQSGETLDTIAAAREAKKRGARLLAITNSALSSLAREADNVLYQRAGIEIAVASTKAYTTQVVCLALISVYLGRLRGVLSPETERELCAELVSLPKKAEAALGVKDEIEKISSELFDRKDIFFIGRGVDYLTAMEGQLKLKEISYIHAEAYAAGELKHGTLALIEPGVTVVAVMNDPALSQKTASNIMEVKARGGRIIAVGSEECLLAVHLDGDDARVPVPATYPLFSPVVSMIPLQLLAYYVAKRKETDIDKPKNLAKSVTVE